MDAYSGNDLHQPDTMSDPFEIGRTYSRKAISEEIGGNPRWALPRLGGKVVCVCLKPENNPNAPRAVFVTEGPGREEAGRQLAGQEEPIPVFLKERSREWRHVGQFEPEGSATELGEIKRRVDEVPNREREIRRVVFLRPAEKALSSNTGVRVFTDDQAYFEWMEGHPDGLVLNTHPRKTSRYATFHQSGCQTISGREDYEPGGYTEREYVKVGSADAQALKEWVHVERPRVRTEDLKRCGHCDPPVDLPLEESRPGSVASAESGSGGTDQTLEGEILRRERTWERLREAGGPQGVETDLLRRLRIYRGQAGIWTDKEETEGFLPDGGRITVSVLHTGEHYPDGLSERELIYQYPETNRPGKTDANEIEATKNSSLGDIPIFVILPSDQDPTLRDVRWGKVTDWNDEAGEFLIQFAPGPASLETTSGAEEKPFRLTENRNEKKEAQRVRREQVQFRFEVRQRYGLRCAVCNVETRELLEAAHIRDRSEEGSNDPRNGLVLCRNHHKAFDDGLFGVDPDTLEIYLPDGGPTSEKLGITRSHLAPKKNRPHRAALQWAWDQWEENLEDEEAIRPVG